MEQFTRLFGNLLAFVYHCFDRMVINGYTQAALAELMRTRGIDLANQSKASKLATSDNTTNNGLINGALTNR